MPNPNVSDGAADVVVCAPYGGALIPNVNPLAVVAAAGSAAAGTAASEANGATGCCCVGAVCCVFETPNAKPVLAVVVCGAPNVKDIF